MTDSQIAQRCNRSAPGIFMADYARKERMGWLLWGVAGLASLVGIIIRTLS
jgi:hypothetical protein